MRPHCFGILAACLTLAATPAGAAEYTFTKIFDAAGEQTLATGPLAINNNGTVAFVDVERIQTLYTSTGPGNLTKIADTSGSFSLLKVTSINNSGVVAFVARSKDGGIGVYTGSAAGVTAIATTATGATLAYNNANPAINDRGEVAFIAGNRIVISSGGQIRTIAQLEVPALAAIGNLNQQSVVPYSAMKADLMTSGVYTQAEGRQRVTIAERTGLWGLAPQPALNDNGTVAFLGLTPDGLQTALYSGSGGALRMFPPTTLGYFPHVSINNSGTILLTGADDSGRLQIFAGPDPVADHVIGVGEQLFGSKVAYLEANPIEGGRAINDRGQIAFRYFDGTRAGVAIATPGSQSRGGGAPTIRSNGVLTASAYGAFSSVAPGTWIEIYGSNLAPATRGWTAEDFRNGIAPTSLADVSVSISGRAAYIYYVSPGQINALVPSDVPTGTAQVTVRTAAGVSEPFNVTVSPTQAGLLAPPAFEANGKRYAAALFADGQTFSVPMGAIAGVASRPARPGETIILYGVGFGPVTGGFTAGTIVTGQNSLAAPVQFRFDGVPATPSYFGLAPGYTGLYQFNIVVPDVPDNDAVPLTFTLSGVPGTQTLHVAVRR